MGYKHYFSSINKFRNKNSVTCNLKYLNGSLEFQCVCFQLSDPVTSHTGATPALCLFVSAPSHCRLFNQHAARQQHGKTSDGYEPQSSIN